MYEIAKKLAKTIIPNSLLNNNSTVRSIVSMVYRGRAYQCNLCGIGLRKFVILNRGDLLCPNCGSLPRTRGLWKLISDKLENKTVLHFSPSSAIKQAIVKHGKASNYITTDFEDEFEAEHRFDIENLSLEDKSIDIIICYHILEHITNDTRAMNELFRVLKEDGSCYVQTPFKEGDIYEDDKIRTAEERLQHFGQRDHVRIYSVDGLNRRLSKVGFKTQIINSQNKPSNYNGLKTTDVTLIGNKQKLK